MQPRQLFLAWVVAVAGLEYSQFAAAQSTPAPTLARAEALQRAQAHRDARRPADALAYYEALLASDPGDAEVYRLRTLTLADLGAAQRALDLYRTHPRWFQAGEGTRLEADLIARRIVWAMLHPPSEATRLEAMRAAHGQLRELLATVPADSDVGRRLRNDELIALNYLGEHAAVIAAWQRARREGRELPPYTGPAVGDSLLAMRQPEAAAEVLESSLQRAPNHRGRILLAYAYLESERFDKARATLAPLRRQAPWLRVEGARQDHANWRRQDADVVATTIDAFAHALDRAQEDAEALVEVGAANHNLHSTVADIYLQRGWGERALLHQRIARTLEPEDSRSRVGEVEALLALDRVAEARPLNAQLQEKYPDQQPVRHLQQRWQRRQGWQLRAESAWGRSEGATAASTSPFGSRDSVQKLRVESPLLDDRWRLLAEAGRRSADFRGERTSLRYAGAGLSYVNDRLRWEVLAAHAFDDLDDGPIIGTTAQWRISDTWRARATLWRNDPQASLQARRAGITADSALLGVAWTPSESAALDASLEQFRFDDGNRRDIATLAGRQRLLARPHFLLDAFGSLRASRNSRLDAPYFNPERDHAIELGLRGDQIVWRRYDRHFRHRLSLSGIRYSQFGFGTHWIPAARYEHEWQVGAGRRLQYGFSWSRPVYDGMREDRLAFDIGLAWGE